MKTRRAMLRLGASWRSNWNNRTLPAMPANAITATVASLMKPYVAVDFTSGVIGGAFHTRKPSSGLNAPRIAAAIAMLMRMASMDWRMEMLRPSSGASMALSSALPSAVSKRMSGNLMATNNPCSGERHQPIAAPKPPAPRTMTARCDATRRASQSVVHAATVWDSARSSVLSSASREVVGWACINCVW